MRSSLRPLPSSLMFFFEAWEKTQPGSDPTAGSRPGPPWRPCRSQGGAEGWGLPLIPPTPGWVRAAFAASPIEGCSSEKAEPAQRPRRVHGLQPWRAARLAICAPRPGASPAGSCTTPARAGNQPAPPTASHTPTSPARFMAGDLWPPFAASITPHSRPSRSLCPLCGKSLAIPDDGALAGSPVGLWGWVGVTSLSLATSLSGARRLPFGPGSQTFPTQLLPCCPRWRCSSRPSPPCPLERPWRG